MEDRTLRALNASKKVHCSLGASTSWDVPEAVPERVIEIVHGQVIISVDTGAPSGGIPGAVRSVAAAKGRVTMQFRVGE